MERDDFHKLSCDALSGIVYEDDSQIDDAHVKRAYDKAHPRIEIEIAALEQDRPHRRKDQHHCDNRGQYRERANGAKLNAAAFKMKVILHSHSSR